MSKTPYYSGFKVHTESHTTEDYSSYDSDDEYSRPSTSTSHSFFGASLVLEGDPPDCLGAFVAIPGDTVYIVSAVYSTGDSFGSDSGYGLEHIAAFLSRARAEACARALEQHGSDNSEGVLYEDEAGNPAIFENVPWNGYFESLDYTQITTCVIDLKHDGTEWDNQSYQPPEKSTKKTNKKKQKTKNAPM